MEIKGKNILVTGGAGFIGSHLVDALIEERPDRIVVVDNLFLGDEKNLQDARGRFENLFFFNEDASNFSVIRSILQENEIDVVFNWAVVPLPTSLERPKWTVDQNILIATTVCELGKLGHFKTLIHCSSSEVYGTARYAPMDEDHSCFPTTPYAASKLATDHIVLSYYQSFGLDTAIIRPFNNFGPRQNDKSYAGVIPIVMNKVRDNAPVEIFGDGLQTRDFIYVKDTARASIEVYKEEKTRGKIINIASGIETSINDLVAVILKTCNLDGYPVIHTKERLGDVRRHCGGIGLAQALIKFETKTDLVEGLEETVRWFRSRDSNE
jgi:UDP-glucose 4-epimerase